MNLYIKQKYFKVIFLFLILIANFLAAITLHLNENFTFSLAYKELILVVAVVFGLFYFRINIKFVHLLVFLVAIIFFKIIMFCLSDAYTAVKLISIRQLFVVYFIFFFGAVYSHDHDRQAGHLFVRLGLFVLFFGLIDRFFYLSRDVITSFFEAKSIVISSAGYPYIFLEPLTYFNEFSGELGFLRMYSFFLDPVNLGHFLVTCYAISNDKSIHKLLFFIGVILCFSKGAILLLFLYISCFELRLPISVKVITCIFIVFLSFLILKDHAGFWVHLHGLLVSLENISILGEGLGKAGNVAVMYGEGSVFDGLGDTFWGAILGQIGIIGFTFYVLCILAMYTFIRKDKRKLYYLFLIQFCLSSLSENSFNFLSVFYLSFLLGYYSNISSVSGRFYVHSKKIKPKLA